MKNDTVLVVKKPSGIQHKKRTIISLSKEKMVMMYHQKSDNSFVYEHYVICKYGDVEKRVEDNREEMVYEISKGISVGYRQGGFSYFEAGLVRSSYNEHNSITTNLGVFLEYNPFQNVIGTHFDGYVNQDIFSYGINLSIYSDFEQITPAAGLMLGVNGRKLGDFAENIFLYGNLNLFVVPEGQTAIPTLNLFQVGLRIGFPLKNKERTHKVINQDYLYEN